MAAVAFWTFHTIWIANVPDILLEGMITGGLAGLAVGWAFHKLVRHGHIPPDWRGGLALAALFWAILLPYEVVGLLFGPFAEPQRPRDIVRLLPLALVGVVAAAAVGWLWTRSLRITGALALATTLVDYRIGGTMAFLGGRGDMMVLFFWMLPTYVLAGLVLVVVRAAVLRRATLATGDRPTIPASNQGRPQEVDP